LTVLFAGFWRLDHFLCLSSPEDDSFAPLLQATLFPNFKRARFLLVPPHRQSFLPGKHPFLFFKTMRLLPSADPPFSPGLWPRFFPTFKNLLLLPFTPSPGAPLTSSLRYRSSCRISLLPFCPLLSLRNEPSRRWCALTKEN